MIELVDLIRRRNGSMELQNKNIYHFQTFYKDRISDISVYWSHVHKFNKPFTLQSNMICLCLKTINSLIADKWLHIIALNCNEGSTSSKCSLAVFPTNNCKQFHINYYIDGFKNDL